MTTTALKMRPSLYVNPTSWTRPPPIDSPKDGSRGSDPHRADDNEQPDSAEEDELADEFEIAYARTLPQVQQHVQRSVHGRSPLRLQHTQSMLPFPRSDANGAGAAASHTKSADDNAVGSPQSDSAVKDDGDSGEDGGAQSQLKRPASLGGNTTSYL